jgi:hypothetical protein
VFLRLQASLLTAAATGAALLMPASAPAQVYGGADRDVPLARFEDPLCPGIIGVALGSAQDMVSLIRESATGLGLPLADSESCEPNLIVAVLNDPRAYADKLGKDRPYLFRDLNQEQRQAFFDAPGPARSWNRVLTRTRDGLPIYRSDGLTNPERTTMMAAHSRIYVPTRRDIVWAIVLLDRKAVQGMTVAQIADYATMRGLSGDAAERLSAPRDSILNLFEAGSRAGPAGLTRPDRIFLQTLYSTMPNNPAAITLAMADRRIAETQAAGE